MLGLSLGIGRYKMSLGSVLEARFPPEAQAFLIGRCWPRWAEAAAKLAARHILASLIEMRCGVQARQVCTYTPLQAPGST